MNLYRVKRVDIHSADYYEAYDMIVVARDANDAEEVSGVKRWTRTLGDDGDWIYSTPDYTVECLGLALDETRRVIMTLSVHGC